jgi:hypothetical protein
MTNINPNPKPPTMSPEAYAALHTHLTKKD